jgi:hypothetical protein
VPSVYEARARLAATKRHHPNADTTALEEDLRAANAEAYLQRVIDEAGMLTPEQFERLRALLTP